MKFKKKAKTALTYVTRNLFSKNIFSFFYPHCLKIIIKYKVALLITICTITTVTLQAQLNVGSTAIPDPSAILQVTSTTKGFLPPSMTTAQIAAIALPAKGLIVYNNQLNQLMVNVGIPVIPTWAVGATAANVYWSALGNTGSVPGTNYLGTNDNASLAFRTNGIERMRIDSFSGRVGIVTGLNIGNELNSIYIGTGSGLVATGIRNHFVGMGTGASTTTGNDNVFTGYQSGNKNTTGSSNTFIGWQAGFNNTTPNSNQFTGYQAGYSNNTGGQNQFSGFQAGYNNTNGYGNMFYGSQAGFTNTSGSFNTFLGHKSGVANTTGNSNTFIGLTAGSDNVTGSNNTFFGNVSGGANTTGNNNQFEGFASGAQNTTGNNNMALGFQSGNNNKTGDNNLFIGFQSGINNIISNNQFIGYQSGINTVSGANNQFSGFQAGFLNTAGFNNMFSGNQAGYQNTVGDGNVFYGYNTGYSNTTGAGNTFIGKQSGNISITGSNNTAIGNQASPAFSNLTNTTSIGFNAQAAASNKLILGGTDQNAVQVGIGTSDPGYTLEIRTADASANILVGTNNGSGGGVLFGNPNYGIQRGYPVLNANDDIGLFTTGANIYLANNVGETNNFVLTGGNSVGIGTGTPVYNLDVVGTVRSTNNMNAPAFTVTSDRRLKQHLIPLNSAINKVMQLLPYSYEKKDSLKASVYSKKEMGFIAQDMRKVFPELVTVGKDADKLLAINYTALIPLLTKGMQEQQDQIEKLTKQVSIVTAANAVITAQNIAITAQLEEMTALKIAVAQLQSRSELNKTTVTQAEQVKTVTVKK